MYSILVRTLALDSFFPALVPLYWVLHWLSLFSFKEINEGTHMQEKNHPSALFTTEASEYSHRTDWLLVIHNLRSNIERKLKRKRKCKWRRTLDSWISVIISFS